MSETFAMPIMSPDSDRYPCPPKVIFTWAVTREHRDQANRNHSQTLERLRERGGLCWSEMEGVLTGLRWRDLRKNQAEAKAACLQLFPQEASQP